MTKLAQEIALINEWRCGEQMAMRELMKSYEPLIRARAHAALRRNRDMQLDDFMQAAWTGFIIACKNFDENRGARIARIADFYIRNEIQAVLFSKRAVSASNSHQFRDLFNGLAREARARGFDIANLNDAQTKNLALSFSCSPQNILAAADFIRAQSTDLDVAGIPPIEADQLERVAENKTRTHIENALEFLPERERLIVELNVIRDPKVTLERIGFMVGLTKERARQLRDIGLGRMRAYFDERGIEFSDLFSESAE